MQTSSTLSGDSESAGGGSAQRTAVVTGASSGIGAATARALAAEGFRVICAARRSDRVAALADAIGGVAVTCDVTSDEDVAALTEAAGAQVHVLVNNAGGAHGLEPIAEADLDAWTTMFEVNVAGVARVTKALLPALIAAGDAVVVNVGSIAGYIAYEGGAGYTAAKHGLAAVTETLRLELWDQPVRVTEIAPGMVRTDEFSLTRFKGDADKAARVYAGVEAPLVAEDIAEAITWMATRPAHVNIDLMIIKPRAQAAHHKVDRKQD
ncbi:MAG: SDR family NAD(P)-dependent oxidoreductase [Actinomycetia bacterium]|nr:SDR family NAD(P)-dependent oxidoreductase [Actinomycetes bacterium]